MNNGLETVSPARKLLVQSVIDELETAAGLVRLVGEKAYSTITNESGSIGGHIRHNLDFVNRFLSGVESGRIDYNQRERDKKFEQNLLYAVRAVENAIAALVALTEDELEGPVLVRSELDSELWLESSIMREFEFLHSHTVHHHAFIKEKLAAVGVRAPANFGVARSTVDFRRKRAA